MNRGPGREHCELAALAFTGVNVHKAVVDLLLAQHVELDVAAMYEFGPLMLAIVTHRARIVAALIETGADTRLCGLGRELREKQQVA